MVRLLLSTDQIPHVGSARGVPSTLSPSVLTRWLRVSYWPPFRNSSRQPLQEALLNYTAIGIFEEWELSMQLFDATVHSPVQRWTTSEAVNLGPQSARREALARWAHTSSEIRKAVAGDLLLYDLSLSIFKKQTTEVLGTVWHGGGTNT